MNLGIIKNRVRKFNYIVRKNANTYGFRFFRQKQAKETAVIDKAKREVLASHDYDIPNTVQLTKEYFDDVQKRLHFNEDFGDYYIQMGDEYNLPILFNKGINLKNCHKYWFGNWYALQRVFDRKSLSLCHDRFCSNCNHLLQASRLKRFSPLIEELRLTHDLYHWVLTVPNCSAQALPEVLDRFYAASKQIIKYLRLNSKIKGVDFSQYGYVGALRSLEIVANPTDYHPHFHFLLVLKKDLPLWKCNVSKFSYKNGQLVRKFSDFELLLQKLLYLAFNHIKVDSESLNSVPLGYSSTLDKVEGDEWHECFKYVTKLTKDGTMETLTYEQFCTLFFVLRKRRIFQGFGCFFRLAENDDIDDEVSEEYARVIAKLRMIEDPKTRSMELEEILSDLDAGHIRVISKYIIQQYLNRLAAEKEGSKM